MKAFNEQNNTLWLLEHDPVYTQGLAGKPEHLLIPNDIPVIQTDRGGQITYHGPGQLMGYTLFNLQNLNLNTRCFVRALEQIIIDLLAEFKIPAYGRKDAPGVYVDNKKIASIGLRVKRNRTYHGLALNVNMDLAPFLNINPCGFSGLQMTQMADFIPNISLAEIREKIVPHFMKQFNSPKM